MKCRGTIPGTNKSCNAVLCETDGKTIFFKLESGRETQIKPKRKHGFSFICEVCAYETAWSQDPLSGN